MCGRMFLNKCSKILNYYSFVLGSLKNKLCLLTFYCVKMSRYDSNTCLVLFLCSIFTITFLDQREIRVLPLLTVPNKIPSTILFPPATQWLLVSPSTFWQYDSTILKYFGSVPLFHKFFIGIFIDFNLIL